MDVLIIETRTGRRIASIPVVLHGMNYTPTEQEYLAEAWRCAVDDGIVEAARCDEYSFQLVASGKGATHQVNRA